MISALLLSAMLAGAPLDSRPRFITRECQRSTAGRSTRGITCSSEPPAFFEFAPISGAGVGSACACTAVTGAGGEAFTTTRSTAGYCTREGLATTGLTTTSMVRCAAANSPRIQAGGDGTLGILVERAATNSVIRSEALENAAWTICSGGAVTVTANAATAPNNTASAERLQLATGGFNALCQAVATTGTGVRVASLYIRDNGSTNGITLRMVGTGDSAGDVTCEALPIASSATWSRIQCVSGNYGAGLTSISLQLFNSTVSATPSVDAFVWGAQLEAGTYPTSYANTAGVAVTRAADGPYQFLGVTLTSLAGAGSASATITPANIANPAADVVIMGSAGRPLYFNTSMRTFDGTTEPAIANGLVAGAATRYWSSWATSVLQVNNATLSTNATGAFDGAMETTGPLQVGAGTIVGNSGDFIISRVCLDPDPLRCR